jgi:predicted transcriptional regulator
MSELTVNLSTVAQETLQKLAENSGETIQEVLEKAIENYRRYIFLTQTNKAFLALRNNETAWQEELQERHLWDETLADGMEKP